MKNFYLSYLMGGGDISNEEIKSLNINIEEKSDGGNRALKIPAEKLSYYIKLIETKLTKGFWNEIVGMKKIIFIFKFNDGSLKRYILSTENEREIDKLCAEFNNEPVDKTANVYKYISENGFYRDFMIAHYSDLINRRKP